METIFGLLFNKKCINCQESGKYICDACYTTLFPKVIEKQKDIVYIYKYKDFVREIIRVGKFGGRHFSYLKYLSGKACEFLQGEAFVVTSDLVVMGIPSSS